MNTLSMVEIIDETVKFFGDDPTRRSKRKGEGLNPAVCSYNGDNGNHCAIGRCLTQEALDHDPDEQAGNTTVCNIWSCIEELDLDLQPQYRGHSMIFWEKLQHLHDCERFWDCNGITQCGMRESLSMQSQFMR